MIYIFNCNWVDTRWQQYSTHLHTNSTQNTENGTYITIKNLTNLGSAGRAPSLTSYTLAFALQLGKKHGKTETRTKSVVSFKSRPIYPRGYSSWYALKLNGPQSRAGQIVVEVNFLPLPENEPRPLCYSAPDWLCFLVEDIPLPLSIILKLNKICTVSVTTILYLIIFGD
jgi:hypothetical protein